MRLNTSYTSGIMWESKRYDIYKLDHIMWLKDIYIRNLKRKENVLSISIFYDIIWCCISDYPMCTRTLKCVKLRLWKSFHWKKLCALTYVMWIQNFVLFLLNMQLYGTFLLKHKIVKALLLLQLVDFIQSELRFTISWYYAGRWNISFIVGTEKR